LILFLWRRTVESLWSCLTCHEIVFVEDENVRAEPVLVPPRVLILPVWHTGNHKSVTNKDELTFLKYKGVSTTRDFNTVTLVFVLITSKDVQVEIEG
jgi:hypothetical protein